MIRQNFNTSAVTLVAGLLTCVFTFSATARELPELRAERVGISTDRLERITDLAENYIAEQRISGIHTMVAREGKVIYSRAVGNRGREDARPLPEDALYRIYSMTKPITSVAAMILYEQGKFQLTDPVSKFVPELANLTVLKDGEQVPAQNTMTMQHLLTHTAGFSYGFNPADAVDQLYREANPLREKDLDAFVAALAKLPLKYEPGTQWHYSVAVDVTGLVVQRLSGQRFDEFLAEHIFEPLDMPDTFFEVPADKLDRFLPNHGWDKENDKEVVFDDTAFSSYTNTTLFSGGGGLVSTTRDYMRFAEMVRNGGSLDGVRILSPKTVDYMRSDHLPASVSAAANGENPGVNISTYRAGFGFGLGFGVVTDPTAVGILGSAGEYSWGGAAGTIFWIDPVEQIVTIAMIQQMGSPWPLRQDLKVLTNQAILELR